MALTMLFDRIAVAPLEDPEKIGSIIIPDIAKQRIDQGIIIFKGPEVKELKIGWHVLFSGYAGTKMSVYGEGTFIIMPEDAVAAVVSESEDWVFTGRTLEKAVGELKDEWSIEVTHRDHPFRCQDPECEGDIEDVLDELLVRLKDHFFAEGLMF